jgi:hypothetical protein
MEDDLHTVGVGRAFMLYTGVPSFQRARIIEEDGLDVAGPVVKNGSGEREREGVFLHKEGHNGNAVMRSLHSTLS